MSARRSAGRGSAPDPGAAHVALLRGVNVGGKNKLPMAELVELFAAAGGRDVRTYIQSGNVVFRAEPRLAARLTGEVERGIQRRFGFSAPVVLRAASELAEVVRRNPFLRAEPDAETEALHVAFLARAPAAGAVAALDPRRSPPDEFAVVGREIYLRLPNGVARTKLTNAWFDKGLATTSTLRNWRTLLALVDLCAQPAAERAAGARRGARDRAR